MPGNIQRRNNILVVSGSDQFDAKVHKALPEKSLIFVDKKKTATLARRALLEKHYDLVIINAPLSDEMGYDLAMDVVEEYGSSVIIATPPEIYDSIWDYVADYGIMVILKPLDPDKKGEFAWSFDNAYDLENNDVLAGDIYDSLYLKPSCFQTGVTYEKPVNGYQWLVQRKGYE